MLQILPFRGVRFDWKRLGLGAVLSPPYDVIPPQLGRRLRATPHNAIHLELPLGDDRSRYRRARRIWRRWEREGWLLRDLDPVYYAVEQRFVCKGRAYRRTGLLAALGLDASGLKRIIPHEKTFSKPKEDRLRLLRALGANTSPIFALYPDPRGTVRRLLARVVRHSPDAAGTTLGGVRLRVWKADNPGVLRSLRRNFLSKRLLIADGHHRLEVAKKSGSETVLCYLCAQEDPGLVVLPTHRVVEAAAPVLRRIERRCRMRRLATLKALESALNRHPSRLAFGMITDRRKYLLAIPVSSQANRGAGRIRAPSTAGKEQYRPRGIRSGLSVEWLARKILRGVNPRGIRYAHDAREAEKMVRGAGMAILVKQISVRDIFNAVRRAGLLPQKSTYFYPKIEAGIVFNPVRSK